MKQYHPVFPQGKKKCFTMSYDDGHDFDVRLVTMMRKHGVRGTFNLNSGLMPEAPQSSVGKTAARLTMQQCVELYGEDMEIAVHGARHPRWQELSTDAAMQDILEDRLALESATEKIIRGAAYPYGTYNDDVVELLRKAGISYCRTTETTEDLHFALQQDWLRFKATCRHKSENLLPLAKKFADSAASAEKLQCLWVWGHAYELEWNDQWPLMEELLSTVGGREDVWYATNIEIVDYCKAAEQLVYSADGTMVQNPTATDIWIACEDSVKVSAGTTVKLK